MVKGGDRNTKKCMGGKKIVISVKKRIKIRGDLRITNRSYANVEKQDSEIAAL